MGVDKAPSTPLPTPLPSRKPPHPEQAATGADLPGPNIAPWRPTEGGGGTAYLHPSRRWAARAGVVAVEPTGGLWAPTRGWTLGPGVP